MVLVFHMNMSRTGYRVVYHAHPVVRTISICTIVFYCFTPYRHAYKECVINRQRVVKEKLAGIDPNFVCVVCRFPHYVGPTPVVPSDRINPPEGITPLLYQNGPNLEAVHPVDKRVAIEVCDMDLVRSTGTDPSDGAYRSRNAIDQHGLRCIIRIACN